MDEDTGFQGAGERLDGMQERADRPKDLWLMGSWVGDSENIQCNSSNASKRLKCLICMNIDSQNSKAYHVKSTHLTGGETKARQSDLPAVPELASNRKSEPALLPLPSALFLCTVLYHISHKCS